MRLTPWRAIQPDNATSGLDKERLEERLAKLVGGPAATEVSPSMGTEVSRAKPIAAAAPMPAQLGQAIVPDGGKTTPVDVDVVLVAVGVSLNLQEPSGEVQP